MKTQTYGLLCCKWTRPPFMSLLDSRWTGARDEYKKCRFNGTQEDFENNNPPYDGTITWIKGRVKGVRVYGVKRAKGEYEYEARYDEGPEDRKWMEDNDIKYLKQLLDKGELKKAEPDVWYLREMDGAQRTDIGEWWSQKLKLPNIGDILKNAAENYKQFAAKEQERATKAKEEAAEKQRLLKEKQEQERQKELEKERRQKEEREREQKIREQKELEQRKQMEKVNHKSEEKERYFLQRRLRSLLEEISEYLRFFESPDKVTRLTADDRQNITQLSKYIAEYQLEKSQSESDCDAEIQYFEQWLQYIIRLDQTLLKDTSAHSRGVKPIPTFDAIQQAVQGQITDDVTPIVIEADQLMDRVSVQIQKEEVTQLHETSLDQLQNDIARTQTLLARQNRENEEQRIAIQNNREEQENRIQELEKQLTLGHNQQFETELEALKQQVTDIDAYQRILWREYQVKEQKRETLRQFESNPNLLLYYRTIQIKLEEIFIGSKAASSEFVDVSSGKVAKAGKAVGLLGELASLAIPMVGNAVESVTKGVEIGIKLIDGKRRDNTVKHISALATLTELKKYTESTARQLTLWYAPQLIRLATCKATSSKRGKLAIGQAVNKTKKCVLKSEEYPPARQFAEFGVLWLLEAFKDFDKIDDRALDVQLIEIITTQKAAQRLSALKEHLLGKFGISTVKTKDGKEWLLEEIYTAGVLEVKATGNRYAGKEINDREYDNQGHRKYGYCIGTEEAARARGLTLQTSSHRPSAARPQRDKQSPSRAGKGFEKEVTDEIRSQREKLELVTQTGKIERQTDARLLREKALGYCGNAEAARLLGDIKDEIKALCQAKAIYEDLKERHKLNLSRELNKIESRLTEIKQSMQASQQRSSTPPVSSLTTASIRTSLPSDRTSASAQLFFSRGRGSGQAAQSESGNQTSVAGHFSSQGR